MAALNPSPTKPIVSFPTASLSDSQVVTTHDSRLPDYQPLAYGTPHPDQVKFPDLILRDQGPADPNDDRMVKRVWGKLPGVELTGQEVTSQFGGGILETSEQKVAAGTSVAGGLNVISASVVPVDAVTSVAKQSVLPAGESWPVLNETEFVPELRVFVTTAKTFVENTGARTGTITGGTGGSDLVVTEYKDFDKWKTIQIVGKVNFSDIGTSRTFRKPMQYSIPDEIPVMPTIIKAYALTGIPDVESTLLDDMLRDAAVTDSQLDYQVVAGYRGSFSATVTRTISMTSATDEEYKWFPTAMQRNLAINGPSFTGGGSVVQQGARGKILSFQTPVAIHPAWNILVATAYTLSGVTHYQWDDAAHTTPTTGWPKFVAAGGTPPVGTTPYWGMQPIFEAEEIRLQAPATTPSAIPHGETIIAAVNSSEWRFGLWINDVYRIVVP